MEEGLNDIGRVIRLYGQLWSGEQCDSACGGKRYATGVVIETLSIT